VTPSQGCPRGSVCKAWDSIPRSLPSWASEADLLSSLSSEFLCPLEISLLKFDSRESEWLVATSFSGAKSVRRGSEVPGGCSRRQNRRRPWSDLKTVVT
jgi:hypothetical protein